MQKIEDEDIELAKSIDNCGIDFNGNKEENFENDFYSLVHEIKGIDLNKKRD